MDRLARRVAAAPSAAPARIRLPVLDAMRLVAAAAIVWLHTVSAAPLAPSVDPLTRFAVPFFTASAVFLLMENVRREPRRRLRGDFQSLTRGRRPAELPA